MCNVTRPCLITCGSSPSSELSSPFRILLLPGEGGIQTFGGALKDARDVKASLEKDGK